MVLIAAAGLFCSAACNKTGTFKTPEWEDPTPSQKDTTKDPTDTTKKRENGKRYYIWIDAAANFPDFANSKDYIRRDLTKAADCGFTDIVVDVRPTTGDVLFESKVGHKVEYLGAWVNGVYTKVTRTATWDYLQAFIDIGHELGLRVHAGFNTMVGGNSLFGGTGMYYRDKSKLDWFCYYNTSAGIRNSQDYGGSEAKFLNPAHPEVREYLLTMIKEMASYKGLDGIVLDRCRYPGLLADFSPVSKQQFLDYLGILTLNWPDDILPAGTTYTTQPSVKPRYYKQWLEFRAKQIHDFVEAAHDVAHEANKDITFGVYVGGWYSQYYDLGVNWAGPAYNAASYFPAWASADYKRFGYADHCDHMLIGAYASPKNVYGTGEWTMQGFCALAKQKIGSACPIVVGGPDVGNWDTTGVTKDQEYQAIVNSVKACADACDGYFLFDMIHLKMAGTWEYPKRGIEIAEGK